MVTPVAKRKAVVHLMEVHQISQRRACDVLQLIGHRCGICRAVAMMLSCVMPSSAFRENGDDLGAVAST